MEFNTPCFKTAMNALVEQIAILDSDANIVFVNDSWVKFGTNNSGKVSNWIGESYIGPCQHAAHQGDETAKLIIAGINDVMIGKSENFCFEYPCHSPVVRRWFLLRLTPFYDATNTFYIVTHQDITQRKLSELKVLELATKDGLTHIANRRKFDEVIEQQWRECRRSQQPISLAMIDIDNFKTINDQHGHPFGDGCLVALASLLESFAQRPTDLCARYGGEEFVLLLAQTELQMALNMMHKVMQAVEKLNHTPQFSQLRQKLSVSIGLSQLIPAENNTPHDLIAQADNLLYRAKESGRNRIEFSKDDIANLKEEIDHCVSLSPL